VTDANLEKWLTEAAEIEPAPGTAALSLFATDTAPPRVVVAPRWAAFLAGTVAAFGFGLMLRRVTRRVRPLIVALFIVLLLTATLVWPLLLAMVAFAVQPGVAVSVVILSSLAGVQSWRRARAARAATFSRGRPESSPTIDLSVKSSRPATASAS
jgi:predicted PurR-regulated permease PerM